MDRNNNGIEDVLENLRFLIQMTTPILVLTVGVVLAVFGSVKDHSDLKDLGTSLVLGGSLANGTIQRRDK